MAEHLPTGPAELGAEMDYAEHERTYTGFIALTKLSIVSTIDILFSLVLYAFGGSWGFLLGTVVLIATMIAAGIDLVSKGSVKASTAVGVLALLFIILTVA